MSFGTMMQSAKEVAIPFLLNKAMTLIVGQVWPAVTNAVVRAEEVGGTSEEKEKKVVDYLRLVAEEMGKQLGSNVLDLIIAAAVFLLRRKML